MISDVESLLSFEEGSDISVDLLEKWIEALTCISTLHDLSAHILSGTDLVTERKILQVIRHLTSGQEAERLIIESVFPLGWLDTLQSRSLLMELLTSNSPQVRAGAGFVLAQVDGRAYLGQLLPLLGDDHPLVRGWVGFALGWHGGEYHVRHLLNHASMTSALFREQAEGILRAIGTKRANEAIKQIGDLING